MSSRQPNLCFFSIWERTETWIAVGVELAAQGVNVCQVVTREQYRILALESGVPEDKVLWLRIDEALNAPLDQKALDQMMEYERITGLSMKNFLMMDRFLRLRPWPEMIQYAAYCFRKIHDFLDKHDITMCSGEPSDTHDLVALLICRATGRLYGGPFDIRFPVNRFALWDSECEVTPLLTGAPTPDDTTEEERTFAAEVKRKILNKERMQFLNVKAKPPGFNLRYFKRITRGALYRAAFESKRDGHMYSLKGAFFGIKYHMHPINHKLNALNWDNLFEQPVEGEKFVLYTLNYQPEHSVDVEAPHFMNFYEVVKSIARSLPLDTKLYVKEHPSALGIRGPKVLRSYKALPGVRLIDPKVDSHDLIKKAELTVCITGTIGIEAALYGRPAATIGNTFIRHFSTVATLTHPGQVGEILKNHPAKHDPEKDIKIMAWMISNSHEGTVVDRITNPIGIAPENIKLVAAGYLKTLNAICSGEIIARPLADGSRPWQKS